MKKDSFLKGAFILGLAGILVKVMGAFFRIPLVNIITSEGMGYYSTAYPLYVLLLVVSTAGFPTAISKLVSEKIALGDRRGAHRVFKVSFRALISVGIITSAILFFGADFLVVSWFKNPKALYSMKAIAPALVFVSVMSSYRGYFQGLQNMKPTAVSQIIEQFFRVGLGLFLAFFFLDKGKEYAAAGASFGATAGAVFGAIFMIGIYMSSRKDIKAEVEKSTFEPEVEETSGDIIKRLLGIAVPITIGAAVIPIMTFIDTAIVMRRLQGIGFSIEESSSLYGQLTGMAATLVNLPQVLTVALSMSLVPIISQCIATKNMQKAKEQTQISMKVASVLSFPAAVGLAVLSVPIMQMLFPNEPSSTGQILLVLSFGVVFLCFTQTFTGIFQGMDKAHVPVINLAIGAVLKIVISYVLTGIPEINVKGAALGTVVAYSVAAILNFIQLKKYMNVEFNLVDSIVKPFAASAIMGAVVKLTFGIIYPGVGNNMACVGSIGVGMAVYAILLFKVGIITNKEIMTLPKGKKLSKILVKLRLISGNDCLAVDEKRA
ncbi:stage V sporulation protein B [Peptoclostridium litorale DSM 5388]|uniref:Polysaccharide biosynthesis protein n=1 Tax=Peptoclostridium litorale DSM 5388 TaxID=1121324 RepID=A0A069RDE2_PEPLI|nr:polysaccharide biosynthesis protein [Peptoclostridium litorale]KDR94240.1 polysaccharide biosynthesis protein [Peptoclostridium litorale DSM 5388]SIO28015.1 stage V sporulation protein B [Peptoclostridium litorale DSM 5388]